MTPETQWTLNDYKDNDNTTEACITSSLSIKLIK